MFTRSTEYALRAVVFLARNTSEEVRFGRKSIALQLGFPEPYLAKILQHLVRSGIIQSAKGPNGGFYATRKTLDISLLDIIDANEGLAFFKRCGLGLVECNDQRPCPIHNEYGVFREGLYKTLSEKKVKDVLNDLEAGIAFMDFI
jgi:Rrf2 family protein